MDEQIYCVQQYNIANAWTTNGKILLAVYVFVIIFIILSNLLFIVGLIRTSQTKCYTHRFLLVIGMTDLCVAFVDFPLTIATNNVIEPTCTLMKVTDIFSGFLDTFTMLNTFGMGVDRYIYLMKPKYREKYSKANILQAYIICSFLFSLSINVSGYVIFSKLDHHTAPIILIALSAILVVFMIFMLCINTRLIYFVNNRARLMRDRSAHRHSSAYNVRASKTISYISIILVIAYTPIIVKNMIVSYYFMINEVKETAILIHIWFSIPWYFYSGLNSTIFMLRNNKVKKFFRRQLVGLKEVVLRRRTVTITNKNIID